MAVASVSRSNAKLWRRGPAPVAAGSSTSADGTPDYGYFGPSSVVWRVLTHPATPAMITQVTALLEMPDAGLFSTVFDHDPLVRATMRGRVRPSMINNRLRRTAGVPVPLILGDTASADRIAAHLRGFHSKMQGTIPSSGEPYDAAGSDLVVFAHVTIMHAALRVYESTGFVGRRFPKRLNDKDRDRYFAEAAQFAILMGARSEDIPRSVAEVRDYYGRRRATHYYPRGGGENVVSPALRSVGSALRHPGDIDTVLIMLALVASHVAAIAIAPAPVRRLFRIPKAADPLITTTFRFVQPIFALLTVPAIGNRVDNYIVGPDGVELARSARALMT